MIKSPYFQNNPKTQEPQISKSQAPSAKMEYKDYANQDTKNHETLKGLTSIIIPSFFNSYSVFHYCGNLIGSILEHTDSGKTPYEIILIQNGNTGIGFNSENARDSYVDKIVFNQDNLGFSKAVNQGIRCANGEYIAIVNTDVQVFSHWLEDMQEALGFTDLVNSCPLYGMPYARATVAENLRNETLKDSLESTLTDDLGLRDFSCILTTKQLFDNVGLFNENFKLYCEDLDLVRRIEKAGGSVRACKRVRTHHIVQGTTSNMSDTADVMNESKKLLYEIWGY